MPLRERDLGPPVAAHFEALGYRVFAEVEIAGRWADLVAFGPSDVVAVELKLRAWRQALRQAVAYQLGADLSFVALPLSSAPGAHRHRFAFEREGIGLLGVDARGGIREILPALPSGRRMPCLTDRLRSALRPPRPDRNLRKGLSEDAQVFPMGREASIEPSRVSRQERADDSSERNFQKPAGAR